MVLDGRSVGSICPAGACVCSKCGLRAMSVMHLNIIGKGTVKLCPTCNRKRVDKENVVREDCKKDKIEYKPVDHDIKWKDF